MIQALELLELTGLETLQVPVDRFDRRSFFNALKTVIITKFDRLRGGATKTVGAKNLSPLPVSSSPTVARNRVSTRISHPPKKTLIETRFLHP
ncbi:hypothetical protein, partial [Lyngbya sp. CCY1209]|uniref:hypothetical protein n=1 Tax=Lyngbya sp. CCY1209 TaxID=2886103 RepID=UPI002D20A1D6